MLSIKPIGSSIREVGYYAKLGQEDYYLTGGEPPGHWRGEGSQALGVNGQVEPAPFRNLLLGLAPGSDTKLVQNACRPERRAAFDLCWSVPKSVSVAWSQANDQQRKEIAQAAEKAVETAIELVQKLCGTTRRGKLGHRTEQAKLIGALFRHETARGLKGQVPDPNLHWHFVLCNVSVREDGSTGSLDARELFRPHMKMALGALFRAELSKQLRAVGLRSYRPLNPRGNPVSWFELDAVPQELVDHFSKRRKQIEAWLDQKGAYGAKAAEQAAKLTRENKENWNRDELVTAWQETGREFGFRAEILEAAAQGRAAVDNDGSELHRVVNEALQTITNEKSRFSKLELLRRTAEAAQGRGLGIVEIRQGVTDTLQRSPQIVNLRSVNCERQYTTREMLELEARLLDRVERARGNRRHALSETAIIPLIRQHETLNSEQVNAIRHITLVPDSIVCINGMAGTGKTFLLSVARKAWKQSGFNVVGTALAAKAAQTLEDGSGIKSLHIHSLLHAIEKGQQELNGNTILVVDEAGMVGTRMMEKLLAVAEAAGTKVVLVGDHRQLQAIDAGAPFRVIAEKLGVAELVQIRRQRERWARQAVTELAAGKSESALKRFADRGFVFVGEDRDEAMQKLVADWREHYRASCAPEDRVSSTKTLPATRQNAYATSEIVLPKTNGSDALIFAGTRLETTVLNRMCQQARLNSRQLETGSIEVGNEQFHIGDRVRLTKNNASLLVKNGSMGTVIAIDQECSELTVRLDHGLSVTLDTNVYNHIALGYAVTTHAGQGQTVESAFVLAGGSMTDRELSYVQGSRARGATWIYTDRLSAGPELEYLANQMNRSRAKDLAHEYLIEAAG